MDGENMVKQLAEEVQAFTTPIDFDQLVRDGLLLKKGKSYYAPDINALPEMVCKRIKDITPTKNGLRVTFCKESKSLKKWTVKRCDND